MNGVVDETGGRMTRAAGAAAAAAAQGQEAEAEGRERVGRSRHEGNERPHAHARHNATNPSSAAAPRARRRVASRHRNAVRQANRLQRPSCRCSRRPPARSAPPSPPILPQDNLASCNEGDAARIRGLWKQPPFIIPVRRVQASWLRLRQQASPAVPTRRFILRSRTVEEEEKINQYRGECNAPRLIFSCMGTDNLEVLSTEADPNVMRSPSVVRPACVSRVVQAPRRDSPAEDREAALGIDSSAFSCSPRAVDSGRGDELSQHQTNHVGYIVREIESLEALFASLKAHTAAS